MDQKLAHLWQTPRKNSEAMRRGLGPTCSDHTHTGSPCTLLTAPYPEPCWTQLFVAFANSSLAHRRQELPHCSLSSHFSNDQSCWASFPMLISHLCISSDDVSIQIICLFFYFIQFGEFFIYSVYESFIREVSCKLFSTSPWLNFSFS